MSLVPFQNFPEEHRKTRKPKTRKQNVPLNQPRKPEETKDHTRKSYTTHISKTSGKTFYVTADGKSTWDKPESESLPSMPAMPALPATPLPEGFEIRTSRSTGEQYYYDRNTGETMWDLPQPPKFVPGSIPHLLERAEDRVINSFGILTCREIKYMLETSEMSEAEQVKFIEDNAKDTSVLRKYIRACNLNPDQLSVITETAPMITAQIQAAVYTLVRENSEPPTEDDPDVEPECVMLRDKVNKFYKNGTGVTKGMWAAFITKAKEVIAAMVSMTYDAFMKVFTSLPTKKQWLYVVQWFVSKGLSFTAWIHSNPKIAYYIMFAFKLAKEKGCQVIGEACKTLEWDPEQLKIIKYLKSAYSEALDTTQQESVGDKILDFMQPLIQTLVIKGAASMVEGVCNVVTGSIATGGVSTTALATLAVTRPVAAFVTAFSMAAVSLSVNVAAEKVKDKVHGLAEELVYYNDIRNAYKRLMDLFNPLPCILEILKITGSVQLEKRVLHTYVWHEIAKNPLYATKATKYRLDIPPIVLRFKNLFLALDNTNAKTYNPALTIGEVRSLLDKYSRLQPEEKKQKVQLLLGPPPQLAGGGIQDAVTYVKTAATNAQTVYNAVSTSIDKSSLYRSIVPKPRNDLVALRDLANTNYYVVEDMWIQVGIYVWIMQQGLITADNKTDFGLLSKLQLKEYNEIEARCRADKYKVEEADRMSALSQWKIEFNDLRYTWDENAFMEVYEGTPPGPVLSGILLMTLRNDVKDLFSKLGTATAEKERPFISDILDNDPYALIASAMDHLRNTTDMYYQEYPVWMNQCFKSLKTGPYPQYYKRLLNSNIAPPYAKILKAFKEYLRIKKHVESGNHLKEQQNITTANAVNRMVGSDIHSQINRYLTAYYEFKTATTEEAKRMCIQVKRAVEIPLKLVESVIKSDKKTAQNDTAGYTHYRKLQLLELMQCILQRLDAPFMKNDSFHKMHGYVDGLKAKLTVNWLLENGGNKFADDNFRQTVVKMWMMLKEAEIYGYSNAYAATQSWAYQKAFKRAVQLRVDYENSFFETDRLRDYIKTVGEIVPKLNGKINSDHYDLARKLLEETKERLAELEKTESLRFEEANAAIRRVYQMEVEPTVWMTYASAPYTPTMLDFSYPVTIKVGGTRKELAKAEIAKHVSGALKEADTISNHWKDRVKKTVDMFRDRMDRWWDNSWTGVDLLTKDFSPKLHFTNCTINPRFKKELDMWQTLVSWVGAIPFSGDAGDPFHHYVNVDNLNLERESFSDETRNALRDAIRDTPFVLYIETTHQKGYLGVLGVPSLSKAEQLFMDNLNPTVYQIFKDLGFPHPSIPASQWRSFSRKPLAEQAKITARLERENVNYMRDYGG